jgi:predicted transposase YbfD/YdcC
MEIQGNQSLLIMLSKVEDPRIDRTKMHNLVDILFIAVCASIANADSWTDIEEFGNAYIDWFRSILELPNGIPSHDTFGRVFSLLDPEQLNLCIVEWINHIHSISEGEIIAIDGKTIRGSFDEASGKKALHLVSAWARNANLALGQVKIDKKSNEVTAIPKLLSMLQLKGAIVTIDAMGCQTKIAQAILTKKADYLLAVKGNQPDLHQDAALLFDAADKDNKLISHSFEEVDKGHGRIETRRYEVVNRLDLAPAAGRWPKCNFIGRATSIRNVKGDISQETRYYIGSFEGDGKKFARAVRGHWSIENSLHWVLDVTFNEDKCRARKDYASENLSVLRKIAINMLKKDTSKGSLKIKRKRAGWKLDYLIKILAGN